MENDTKRRSLSVIELIENGLHTNAVAYSAAQTLLSLHGQLDSIRHVCQKNIGEAENVYDAQIGCRLIVEWMEKELAKIEKLHDEKLNVNHYNHNG